MNPCLYIGLGGTGIRTLLKTKKQFIDTYGEIPPTVHFLGIDTNRGDFAMSIRKVSEVLDYLPDNVFMKVNLRAADKAEPMLMISPGGGRERSLIIGVEERENSRFVKSRSLQESIQHIEFVSTGIKNRVLFYRQDFAFPAFTVQGVDDWRKEYEMLERRLSSHFDAHIFDRMVRENYSIYPQVAM